MQGPATRFEVRVCKLEDFVAHSELSFIVSSGLVIKFDDPVNATHFNIIVDGGIREGCGRHIPVGSEGTTCLFNSSLTSATKLLLFTDAWPDFVRFLCIYCGQLRSSADFTMMLDSLGDASAVPASVKDERMSKWLLGKSEAPEVSSSLLKGVERLWSDLAVNPDGDLPAILMASPTVRLLRLIAQDMLLTSDDAEELEHRWVCSILGEDETESLKTKIGERFDTLRLTLTGVRHSPLTQHYFEFLLWSKLNLFPLFYEGVTLSVGGTSFKLTPLPAGGYLSNTLWLIEIGAAEVVERLLITNRVIGDCRSDFHSRICQPFNANILASAVQGKRAAAWISTSPETGGGHHYVPLPEDEIVASLADYYLGPGTHALVPVTVKDALGVLLLVHLVWMNMPIMRERVSIAVVSPVAKMMATTLRLLLESMSDDIRQVFITHKLNLIGILLEGLTAKGTSKSAADTLGRIRCFYYEDFESMRAAHERSLDSLLVLATPASMDEDPSKSCFAYWAATKKSSCLFFVRPPSSKCFAARLAEKLSEDSEADKEIEYSAKVSDGGLSVEILEEARGVVKKAYMTLVPPDIDLPHVDSPIPSTNVVSADSPGKSSNVSDAVALGSMGSRRQVFEDSRKLLENAITNFFTNKMTELQMDSRRGASYVGDVRLPKFQSDSFFHHLQQYIITPEEASQLFVHTMETQKLVMRCKLIQQQSRESFVEQQIGAMALQNAVKPRLKITFSDLVNKATSFSLDMEHERAVIANFDSVKEVIETGQLTELKRRSKFQDLWRDLPGRPLESGFLVGDVIITREAPDVETSAELVKHDVDTADGVTHPITQPAVGKAVTQSSSQSGAPAQVPSALQALAKATQHAPASITQAPSQAPPQAITQARPAQPAVSNALLAALQNISAVLKKKPTSLTPPQPTEHAKEDVVATITDTHLQHVESNTEDAPPPRPKTSEGSKAVYVTPLKDPSSIFRESPLPIADVKRAYMDIMQKPILATSLRKEKIDGGSRWHVQGKLSLETLIVKQLVLNTSTNKG
eukprot:Blabericola_migrator_1__9550@NODE_51_length_16309_cov_78_132619_g47_i0_p3_GENE_NODE_51_length_16309_cov_78_132619_g47_i0NODE_51_length_16309_cov_78_132619_g47_i0_p3_ORF_typecomplete_len1035_score221_90BetaCasp/PF10996_8/0_0021_NODE_51_length_16309_cov_78_132619_g47_i012654369